MTQGAAAEKRPNVLFIMTDQQRFDTVCSLGNTHIYTPNLDRLAARGMAFTNAYSTSPVCVPARYTIRTGCEALTTGVTTNGSVGPQLTHREIEDRCGPYLAATMGTLGYRTFGVGKFHTTPWNAPVGFEAQLYSEEAYTAEQRPQDSYVAFLESEHPEYSWIESLHGERTEMYYMPQRSPLPAELTVEAWAADRAIELINVEDDRPYFGFVSFIGPHPPFAPPQPFNRLYNPDRMPDPVRGELAVDHMDQALPLMNHLVWAEDITDAHARVLKARYYGEITYIDQCVGRILDAVEARSDADNTLICFFADHGEHLGDHHSWQKEGFFEASARIPFLVSWPGRIPVGVRTDLVCLTDLFGIATTAAGAPELREGTDVLGQLTRDVPGREFLFGYLGDPGTSKFKLMVRHDRWKLIYLANGGLTQLFDVEADPHELNELSQQHLAVLETLLQAATDELAHRRCHAALDNGGLRAESFQDWRENLGGLVKVVRERFPQYVTRLPTVRIHQFDVSSGALFFPEQPSEVI